MLWDDRGVPRELLLASSRFGMMMKKREEEEEARCQTKLFVATERQASIEDKGKIRLKKRL